MPFVDIAKITIPEDRQREDIGDVSGIATSISRRLDAGRSALINPVILDENFRLCAGFRRYSAHMFLELPEIEFRFENDLTEQEREILELEENVHRKQLEWHEEAKAIARIHEFYSSSDAKWTAKRTADALGLSPSSVSRALTVISAAEENPEIISKTTTMAGVYNRIRRKEERKIADQLETLRQVESTPDDVAVTPPKPAILPATESILNQSFLDWAPKYSGPRFNFLHCDFPYGIEYHDSDQAHSGTHWDTYSDSAEVYWQLLNCLADNWDNLMAQSSHIMFWYSLKHQKAGVDFTRQFFAERLPQVVLNPMPLIWLKTDNKGILPDAQRGPRQIYETALFGYTGDRKIVSAVGNAYGCPTNKTRAIHQSEKPQPMLEFFFRMLVDSTTKLLDPTCGGGSAVRSAERLGAETVLGLELDPLFAEAAQAELGRQRALEAISL